MIEFRSDSSNNGRGFLFSWESDYSNRTIGWPFAGLIQSPNYPYMYPNNVEANWNLIGPLGSTITIGFNAMDLEACNRVSCYMIHVAVIMLPFIMVLFQLFFLYSVHVGLIFH